MLTSSTTDALKKKQGFPLGKLLLHRAQMSLTAFEKKYGTCFLLLQEKHAHTTPRRRPTREMRSVRELKTSNVQLIVFALKRAAGAESSPGTITLGRTLHNDVCIPDISISRVHAVFKIRRNEVMLIDIGSSNGTFIGDEKLEENQPFVLTSGMQLRFGAVVCELAKSEDLPLWRT